MSYGVSPVFRRTFLVAAALIVAVFCLLGFSSSAFAQTVIYDSMPAPIPSNVPSHAFAATSTSEFGDHIEFVPGTGRRFKSVTILLSSWACENGGGTTCTTTPGAAFSHAITLNLYNVDHTGTLATVGTAIAAKTQTFDIPYRPSYDATKCFHEPSPTDGPWWDGTSCKNGLATPITFDLTSLGIAVPDEVIWSVSYNTTFHGHSPLGENEACYTDGNGCGYDSLNVGVGQATVLQGIDVAPDSAFLESTWGGAYCDNGDGGTGTFRRDDGCWSDYDLNITVIAESPCSTACYVAPTGSDSNLGNADSPKQTIQAGINAVQAGGTVSVKNGTYPENLTIGKNLSLIGESQAGTVIDATSKDGVQALYVSSGNIVLKNFTLKGHQGSCSNNTCRGIKIEGTENSATLENVTVQDAYRAQIDLNGQKNVLIKNVTASGAVKGTGLILSNVQNVVVDGLTTHDNAWGGVTIASSKISPVTNNIEFKGVPSLSEALPIHVEANYVTASDIYPPVTNVTVPGYEWAVTNFRSGTNEKQWLLYPTQGAAAGAPPDGDAVRGTPTQLVWPASFYYPPAQLLVPNATHQFTNNNNTAFDVPVQLAAPGSNVYSLRFTVAYSSCLGVPTVSEPLSDWGAYLEQSAPGSVSIGVASLGAVSATALPNGNVAVLHFANAGSCPALGDMSSRFSFGPLLECGASDGIGMVACTGTPGTVTLDFNQAPTGITLSQTHFAEPVPVGSTGAIFTTTDPDGNTNFTYSLVTGEGSTDNDKFDIVNGVLGVKDNPLYAGTYHIRVRSTDQGNESFEQEFTIVVFDTATLSIGADTSAHHGVARMGKPSGEFLFLPVTYVANGNAATSLIFKVNFDPACLDVWSETGYQAGNGFIQFAYTGDSATQTMPVLQVKALTTCPDTSAGSPATAAMMAVKQLTLQKVEFKNGSVTPALDLSIDLINNSVTVIDNSDRGNCNADLAQAVNAADYVATVLEIFDTDGTSWLNAPTAGFDGSPYGCNSSQDAMIAADDIVCTVHLSFGNTAQCPGSTAVINPASPAYGVLDVAATPATAGATVDVPLHFDAAGQNIGALVFSLNIDPAKATFDAADVDGDDNPDAVHFKLADGQAAVALYDAAAHKLNVAIFAVTSAMQPVSGDVASVSVTSLAGESGITVDSASASTVDGVQVAVIGSVGGVGAVLRPASFIPLLFH